MQTSCEKCKLRQGLKMFALHPLTMILKHTAQCLAVAKHLAVSIVCCFAKSQTSALHHGPRRA